jgi:hypothetical protein
MGWSPLVTILAVLGVWVAVSILVGWLASRWFRWVRGDFDRQ